MNASQKKLLGLILVVAVAGGGYMFVKRRAKPGTSQGAGKTDGGRGGASTSGGPASVKPTVATTKVAFMRMDVKKLTPIEPKDVEIRNVEVDVAPKAPCITSFDEVENRLAKVDLMVGEPLFIDKTIVLKAGEALAYHIRPGMRAVGVSVNQSHAVGGFLREDNFIDLLVTFDRNTPFMGQTLVLCAKCRVLAVGDKARGAIREREAKRLKEELKKGKRQVRQGKKQKGISPERNPYLALKLKQITIEVTPDQARRIALMPKTIFDVALRNPSDEGREMTVDKFYEVLAVIRKIMQGQVKIAAKKRAEEKEKSTIITVVRGRTIKRVKVE